MLLEYTMRINLPKTNLTWTQIKRRVKNYERAISITKTRELLAY